MTELDYQGSITSGAESCPDQRGSVGTFTPGPQYSVTLGGREGGREEERNYKKGNKGGRGVEKERGLKDKVGRG